MRFLYAVVVLSVLLWHSNIIFCAVCLGIEHTVHCVKFMSRSFVDGVTFLCGDGTYVFDVFPDFGSFADCERYSKMFSYFTVAVAIVVATYASIETGNYVPLAFTAFFSLFGFTISDYMDKENREQRKQTLLLRLAMRGYRTMDVVSCCDGVHTN